MVFALVSVIFVTMCAGGTLAQEFTYDLTDNVYGPLSSTGWPGVCQTGLNQSPINLVQYNKTCTGFRAPYTSPLAFSQSYYSNPLVSYNITNTGHSVQINIPQNGPNYTIWGGGLNGTYVLQQLHFHWSPPLVGGEHDTYSNMISQVEVHFVSILNTSTSMTDAENTTKYGNAGIAVVAVVYQSFNYEDQVGGVFLETYDMGFMSALAQQAVKNVQQYNQTYACAGCVLYLDYMIPGLSTYPSKNASFFRYYGSLTTPPCTETVVWTVFQENLPIMPADLAAFAMVQNDQAVPMHNSRPPQNLNGRAVDLVDNYGYCSTTTGPGGAVFTGR